MTNPSRDARPLIRMVYASRATAECLADLDGQLRSILAAAILNNRPKAITGLLIAHRGWFLQALEGPASAVRTTFKAICNDSRHRDAVILGEGPITNRAFGSWSMCARQLSPTDALVLGELDRRPAFNPSEFPERVVMRLLTAVGDVHSHALSAQQALVPA